MSSSSTSRKKSKKVAEEVITLGSSDEEEQEYVKEGRKPKARTINEKFHESIVAVARTFRSSFTLHEFSIAFSSTFRCGMAVKELGYSCAREALYSVKGIREEEGGDYSFVEGSLSEKAFAARLSRLKELQKKVATVFRTLREPFSCNDVIRRYQWTYKEQTIPFVKVGFDKLSAFLTKHPELEEIPGTHPLFKVKGGRFALKDLRDRVSAVARTLSEPFSCSAINENYLRRYKEVLIPFKSFGFEKLDEFCTNHPELEEVRGKCGDLLFKMKNAQKKRKRSAVAEEGRINDECKISKRKLQQGTLDLQSAGSDFGEVPAKKKKKSKAREVVDEECSDGENSENDHGEKLSMVIKTGKVASKKKHKKGKTVSVEKNVEADKNELEVDVYLQATGSGEDRSKKKKMKRDESKNAIRSENPQNDHGEEQSKTIKTEESSRKKKKKENDGSVKESVEVDVNDRAEGEAVVFDEKPVKKEIVVDQPAKNVNENVMATETHDPTLMTAPFAPQMPPMPIHFPPMMPFAPPSRHAILGNFIAQMLEHAEYRGQNADEIGSKLLQVINESNKPTR